MTKAKSPYSMLGKMSCCHLKIMHWTVFRVNLNLRGLSFPELYSELADMKLCCLCLLRVPAQDQRKCLCGKRFTSKNITLLYTKPAKNLKYLFFLLLQYISFYVHHFIFIIKYNAILKIQMKKKF
jgi:hypothetical protein